MSLHTITATLTDLRGAEASSTVRIERLSGPEVSASGEIVMDGVRIVSAGTLAADGIELPVGRYVLTWWVGPSANRLVIEIPDRVGSSDIATLVVGVTSRAGRIYWGSSSESSLTEAQILEFEDFRTLTSPVGTYPCIAGGYKYIAWPDAWGTPTGVPPFSDAATGFPVSLAGETEGFTAIDDGIFYRELTIGSTAYRLYRTRNVLGGAFTWKIA